MEANKSADATPAPIPMRKICTIELSRSIRAVRDGSTSAPTIGPWDDPGNLAFVFRLRFVSADRVLSNHVGQQTKEARALDGLREFALLFCRNGGDAARYDLAALGDVALQQSHVFVVDLGRVGAGERASLATAEERPAATTATAATTVVSTLEGSECH